MDTLTNQLSDRINNLAASATLAMAAKARELRAEGKDIIGLSLGEPDFNTPDFIKDEYPNIIFDHAREKYPEMDWGVDLDNDEKNIDSPPEKNPKVRSPLSKFKIGVIFLLILIIVSSISTIEEFFIFLKN